MKKHLRRGDNDTDDIVRNIDCIKKDKRIIATKMGKLRALKEEPHLEEIQYNGRIKDHQVSCFFSLVSVKALIE